MPFASTLNRIPSGQAGTAATLDAMERAVRQGLLDPAVALYAQDVVRDLPEHDVDAEIAAVFARVRDDFRYTRDPLGVELVKTPTFILEEIRTHGRATLDCDDASVWLAALLRALGIPTRFKAIRGSRARPRDFSHVFVEAQGNGGRWWPLDPIARQLSAGEEPPALFGAMLWGTEQSGPGAARTGVSGMGGPPVNLPPAPNPWQHAMAYASRSFGYGGVSHLLGEDPAEGPSTVIVATAPAPAPEPEAGWKKWILPGLLVAGAAWWFMGRKKRRRNPGRRRRHGRAARRRR